MASTGSSSSKVFRSMQGISLVKVQNRTYRVPTASLSPHISEKRGRVQESPSSSSDEETETIYTEDIITYYHPVPTNFHGILIGRGGTNLKRIRTATGTRIDVKSGRDTVLIKGTQDKIEKAKEVIDTLIREAYNRTPPTHFLSIPLSSPYTTRKMEEFQSSILSSSFKCDGMDPSILVSPLNLHITLGVFKLLNQEEIERAVRFLKEDCAQLVKDTLRDGKALNVHLRGLNIMQNNPATAHVLYIEPKQPEDDDRLGKLCSALIEKMVNAGLMVQDDRPFKMHATLINTSHRKNDDKKKRLAFDARPVLKEFGQLDLGTVKLEKLHLMKMGRRGPNNTYISEGSISL